MFSTPKFSEIGSLPTQPPGWLPLLDQSELGYCLKQPQSDPGGTGDITTDELCHPVLESLEATAPTINWQDDYLLTGVLASGEAASQLNSSESDINQQLLEARLGEPLDFDNSGSLGETYQLNFPAPIDTDYSAINGKAATAGQPLNKNQSVAGTLVNGDPNNYLRSGSFYDDYYLSDLAVGEQVQVNVDSSEFDTYLQLLDANTGQLLEADDDGGFIYNSQLAFAVEEGVNYLVRVTSFDRNATGQYSVTNQILPINPNFNSISGYGLVNAATAVATAIGEPTFAEIPDGGGLDWHNDQVKAPEAWARGFTGQGVTVAVIDTGVDITHTDLVNNIWVNPGEVPGNGIDDDANGYVDDLNGWNFAESENNNNVMPGNYSPDQGHGTHVAGTIAAMNNGFGITGVAYDAKIMAIRMGEVTDGFFVNSGNLASAIRYAVDNGAKVINLSLGWDDSVELRDALAYAAANNVITVSAAGNSGGSNPGKPANYSTQYGLSVGAVDDNDHIANFSNRAGLNSSMRYVVAPGVSVYSTTPGNTYEYRGGTSMSNPHVAGVVALMLSANPNLTHDQVRDVLTSSATKLA
ncbi:S8 family serine peptidase [Lyngbya aestuarii]|uniref:S8 family serine peptidase n=1 Tax=Lyngbya aestuarii TaxID=118322 RepID=UPI00403D75B3